MAYSTGGRMNGGARETTMAADRKENSVLFSLKELKDITADEPEAPARPKVAPVAARRAPAPTSDDRESLLGDLRSLMNEDAAAESSRLDAERLVTAEVEARKVLETSTLQRFEIEARIAAEQARRRAADDERAARTRQLDIEERRARGEIIEEPARVEVLMTPAVVSHALPAPQVLMPTAPAGRSASFYLTVVGLPVLCVTGVFIVLIMSKESVPPPIQQLQPAIVVVSAPPPPPTFAPVTQAPAPVLVAAAPVSEAVRKGPKRTGGKGGPKATTTPDKGPKLTVDLDEN